MKLELIAPGQLSVMQNDGDSPEQSLQKITAEANLAVKTISPSSEVNADTPKSNYNQNKQNPNRNNLENLNSDKLDKLLTMIEEAKHKKHMREMLKVLEYHRAIKRYKNFEMLKQIPAKTTKKVA